MDKKRLKEMLGESKSLRAIGREMGCSLTTVRYWVDRWNLSKSPKRPRCRKCGETRLDQFYSSKTNRTLCKFCHNDYTIERHRKKKGMAVTYLGGKCLHCDYDHYIGALEFHHRDGRDESSPDRGSSWFRQASWNKLKIELDKCDLLCSRCHREEHARLRGDLPPRQESNLHVPVTLSTV